MISDNLNWYNHGGYTEMTAPSSNVNITIKGESKRSIVNEKLSQSCSTNKKNQNSELSTNFYRRNFLRTRTNYVLRRKTNQNAQIRNKNTQIMRLHAMWRTILKFLTYLNAEETILTCHVKERAWILKTMNNLQTFLTLWTDIKIVTSKDCPVKSSKKLFVASWMRKKKRWNVT